MSYCHPFAPVAFRRAVYPTSIQADFTPFFRMFDDLDQAITRSANGPRHHQRRSFQPRFDVTEAKEAFHLHGELPGIDQKDVNIEFVDQNTLVVSGKSHREYNSSNDNEAAAQVETTPEAQQQPSETAANEKAADDFVEVESTTEGQATPATSNYHAPTIENEEGETSASAAAEEPKQTEPTSDAVATQNNDTTAAAPAKKSNKPRYWVHERSTGEFQRSFTFHGQIDQDAVTASLKNGVLNIVVPKAQVKQPRKITLDA